MPFNHKLLRPKTAVASGPPPFSPLDIANLALWLDASDSASLFDATSGGSAVAADGSVARWEDKSGNARHFTQSTANNRPTLTANAQNGLPGLNFDGSNDWLYNEFVAVRTAVSVFVAGSFDDNTSRRPLIDIARADGNNFRHFVIEQNTFSTSGQKYGMYAGNNTWDSSASTSSGAKVFGILYTHVTSIGSVPSNTDYRVNGTSSALTQKYSSGQYTADYSVNDRAGVMLGSYNADGSALGYGLFHDGKIYEVAIYSRRLSTSEASQVETYLMQKWGIG